MSKRFLVDTSTFIQKLEAINKEEIVLSISVIRELEKLKDRDSAVGALARKAIRWIKANRDELLENGQIDYEVITEQTCTQGDLQYADNQILELAKKHNWGIITEDNSLSLLAQFQGTEVREVEDTGLDVYSGVKVVEGTMDDVQNIRRMSMKTVNDHNLYGLLMNQYLLIKTDEGDFGFKYVTTKDEWVKHVEIQMSELLDSNFMGRVQAKNIRQAMAINALKRDSVVLLGGKAGSGKTYLALSHIMAELQHNQTKIYIFVNNQPVRGANTFGLLKGDLVDKVLQSNIGSILATKLGGLDTVRNMIHMEQIVVLPIEYIRGVSIEDSIAFFTEAQNISKDLMKTILERISDSSQLIMDYDLRQIDTALAMGYDNGINRLLEVYKGQDFFSHVMLEGNQRGKISTLADKM